MHIFSYKNDSKVETKNYKILDMLVKYENYQKLPMTDTIYNSNRKQRG